jgi:hypothetical protein
MRGYPYLNLKQDEIFLRQFHTLFNTVDTISQAVLPEMLVCNTGGKVTAILSQTGNATFYDY